jgi:hypothetical protein
MDPDRKLLRPRPVNMTSWLRRNTPDWSSPRGERG